MAPGSTFSAVLGLAIGLSAHAPAPAIAGGPTIVGTSAYEGTTEGDEPLVVFGSNFGKTAGSVTLGPWTCPIESWSDQLIECRTPPGWGAQNHVIVHTAEAEASDPWYFTYFEPTLLQVDPWYLAPEAGTLLTLTGWNFGVPEAPLVVEFGGIPGQVISHDHTTAQVASPGGEPGAVSLLCIRMGVIGEESCDDIQFGNPVGVDPPRLPTAFALRLAGANPAREATAFAIDLPRDARYALDVFDSKGRLVRRYTGDGTAGMQVVRWDGAAAGGACVPAGLYWARLEVAGERFVRKVMRL